MKSDEVLKYAEVKRINERLTKRELADICEVSYNFYINCSTGNNFPSAKMISSLSEYIETPTCEVYQRVFRLRKVEDGLHKKMEVCEEEYDQILLNLRKEGQLEEPI